MRPGRNGETENTVGETEMTRYVYVIRGIWEKLANRYKERKEVRIYP